MGDKRMVEEVLLKKKYLDFEQNETKGRSQSVILGRTKRSLE
jgi:hypothetical protein